LLEYLDSDDSNTGAPLRFSKENVSQSPAA